MAGVSAALSWSDTSASIDSTAAGSTTAATCPGTRRQTPRGDYRQHVTTPLVTLRPITDTEFASWRDRAAASFAAGIGPAQGLDPAEALEFAYRETDKLLPAGHRTENHLIWLAYAGNEPVGSLWINTRTRGAFIYGIEVDADHRGKGYGRAIMLAGEDECRRRGDKQARPQRLRRQHRRHPPLRVPRLHRHLPADAQGTVTRTATTHQHEMTPPPERGLRSEVAVGEWGRSRSRLWLRWVVDSEEW